MLERTAGCLEPGSLRRLLPRSEGPFKSRRMLHSAFWNHGASELDLSSFCIAFASEPRPEYHDQVHQKQGSSPSIIPILDFLYPSNTLALLGQYSNSWLLDRQDPRRIRSNFTRFGQRFYSSMATKPKAEAENIPTDGAVGDTAGENGPPTLKNPETLSAVRQLIESASSTDYEETWRLYSMLEQMEKRLVDKDLLPYLATSKRRVDADRAIGIFAELPLDQRNDKRYSSVIRAYITLDDIPGAIKMHQEAVASPLVTKDHPAGTDYLIAHCLNISSYSLAWEAWQRAAPSRKHGRFALWHAIDQMPNLQDCALSLADFNEKYTLRVSRTIEVPEEKSLAAFTAVILYRALIPKKEALDSTKHLALWRFLRKMNADSPDIYEATITKLLDLGHDKLATQCYRQFRQRTTGKISRPTLHGILQLFCKNYSILGMQQIMDDFFHFYAGPTRTCYKMCLTEFAAQGDVVTVKKLFEQFSARFFKGGTPNDVDELAPLLHVHARRGELDETVAAFNDISHKYGLTPNLASYNILLNAHAKVNDIDGAVVLFENLLQSKPFAPDHISFGTMMGICVARGDLDGVKDLFQLVEDRGVPKSIPMIDSLVLGHLQEGQLIEAEEICENALKMDLTGSRLRMWNYILTAYAMRTDLANTNRILRRMQDVELKFDALTYSALMQVLAMSHQPDRAYTILTKVMPQAGIRATNFHYAVVMGGYIANGEVDKVFSVHNRMLDRGLNPSTSTHKEIITASALQDQKDMDSSPEARLQRADQYFQAALSTMDAQDITQSPRKGQGRVGLDLALPSAYFDYLLFVYAQRGASNQVQELYGRYLAALPPNRRNKPTTKILNALMISKLREKDYAGVAQCWNLIFAQIKNQNVNSVRFGGDESDQSELPKILESREFELSVPLSTYISSLGEQNRIRDLHILVTEVLTSGFKLDNKNWNLYVQTLARKWQYREAFEICEQKLMDGWTGWARLRWQSPVRNRLSLGQRLLKKDRTYLRPKYHTILFLGRALLELQASSAEGKASRELLAHLNKSCPQTLAAIRSMQRLDTDLERAVLGGDVQRV